MDLTLLRGVDPAPEVIVELSMAYITPAHKAKVSWDQRMYAGLRRQKVNASIVFITTALVIISKNRLCLTCTGRSPWSASSFHISLPPLLCSSGSAASWPPPYPQFLVNQCLYLNGTISFASRCAYKSLISVDHRLPQPFASFWSVCFILGGFN